MQGEISLKTHTITPRQEFRLHGMSCEEADKSRAQNCIQSGELDQPYIIPIFDFCQDWRQPPLTHNILDPVGSMPSEGVDRSRASRNLTTVRDSTRDHVFVSCTKRNSLIIDKQRVAALNNDHILVEIVNMLH
jgi:hypothetical protein